LLLSTCKLPSTVFIFILISFYYFKSCSRSTSPEEECIHQLSKQNNLFDLLNSNMHSREKHGNEKNYSTINRIASICSINASNFVNSIMFGPSLKAMLGSKCVSKKKPSTPTAAAARER